MEHAFVRRRFATIPWLLAVMVPLVVGVAAWGRPEPVMQRPAGVQVSIRDMAYEPADVNIPLGYAVTWTNNDPTPHTVTSQDKAAKFDSGDLAQGQSFTHVFDKAGKFTYVCAHHPSMKGTVTVLNVTPPPSPFME